MDGTPLLDTGLWWAGGGAWAIAVGVRAWRRRYGRLFPANLGRRHTSRARGRTYRAQVDAERRAEALLREVIGEEAFGLMARRGYLEVRSPTFPSRIYLVPERQGPVTVCENGRPVMRLCVQTVERVPDHDTVVMHKLMIEGNERDYLRIANRV